MTTASWARARRARGSRVGKLELWAATYGAACSRPDWAVVSSHERNGWRTINPAPAPITAVAIPNAKISHCAAFMYRATRRLSIAIRSDSRPGGGGAYVGMPSAVPVPPTSARISFSGSLWPDTRIASRVRAIMILSLDLSSPQELSSPIPNATTSRPTATLAIILPIRRRRFGGTICTGIEGSVIS
jgi:hypothetical protein